MPKINRPPQDGFIGSVKSHNNRLSYLERSVATSTPGARVTGASNAVANGGTAGIVNFTTVTYAFSPMTASGAQITAPVTGVYSAKVYVEFGPIASGQANFFIANATQLVNQQIGYATTNERSLFASDDVQANAGDVLQVALNNSTGGTMTFTANSYFTLTYVSSGSAAVATGSAGTTSVSSPITNTGTGSSPIIGLSTSGAVSEQVLGFNGTNWVPATRTVTPGRFMIIGHSYAAPPPDPYEYAAYNQNGSIGGTSSGTTNFQRMWPSVLRNMLGMGRNTDNVLVAQVPAVAAASNATTYVGMLPEEGWIDFCAYLPNANQSGVASPNGRSWALQVTVPGSGTATTIAYGLFNSSPWYGSISLGTQQTILSAAQVSQTYPIAYQSYRNASGNYTTAPQLAGSTNIIWKSSAVGTGGADPGGLVYVRYNTRFRNYSVSGSLITQSGVYGGWANFFCNRPHSQGYFYIGNGSYFAGLPGEINVSATAAGGATSISCDALCAPIANGSNVVFSTGNGATVTATLTAQANAGATSLTVSALSGSIPAGSSGFAKSNTGGYESFVGPGMLAILHGINDCGQTTFDINAFKETMRSVIANASCAYMSSALQSNIVYTAGNGTGATWTTHTQPAGGQFWNPRSFTPTDTTLTPTGSVKMFSGAVGATPPTISINIPPAFEGGSIDLFFLGLAGANNGGAANISVDGGSTVAAINTNNVSPTSGSNSTSIAVSAFSATTTLTASSGTFSNPGNLGQFIVGTGITAGTSISSTDTGVTISNLPVAQPTSVTISASSTGSAQTVTLLGFTPMVKRLTGLASGAHTIKITLTSMGAGSVPRFFFYGYGIEASNTTSPDLSASIAVCNIARIPSSTMYPVGSPNANVVTANAGLTAVVQGTSTSSQSGNTSTYGTGGSEPALNTQAFIVDTDTALGGSTSSTNFSFDGLHPNARGHAIIANAIFNGMISTTGITPVNLAVSPG
jgi:hypothetical protein